jgi:hypothetical protein
MRDIIIYIVFILILFEFGFLFLFYLNNILFFFFVGKIEKHQVYYQVLH